MRKESLYTLRLWRDSDTHEAWRYCLTNVRTGECETFATFEALCKSLEQKLLEKGGGHVRA